MLTQKLARKGPFDELSFIDAPNAAAPIDLEAVFDGIDSAANRLVVLDPRRWTLLNGRDALSRAEITAILGLGPTPMRVDNAASCVIVCVNTQRREIARKRAGEVLAWRHVLKQINPDEVDELREANVKHDEVMGKLRKDLEKAFQHYAYLVRAGTLVVEFKRFDDDTRTSLRGDQLWTALVEAGRASIVAGLSADYLAALLGGFDRTLTLKEVVQSFYKNPSFPLVPSTDDIRGAIHELVRGDWELIDSDGNRLTVGSPSQISINSISQELRRRVTTAPTAATTGMSGTTSTTDVPGGSSRGGESLRNPDSRDELYRADSATTSGTQSALATGGAPAYKRYIIELVNRSITSPEVREQVWQLLRELAKVVDSVNATADHQLLTMSLTLTTAVGDQGNIEEKARQAGARVRVEDEDF